MRPPIIIRGALPNLMPSSRQNQLSVEQPQPQKRTIDPSYLDISNTPSSHIPDPTCHRKLLILDLNGSLLFRPKRYAHGCTTPNTPKTRVVHLRPYMPSFREYLLHPETKTWLDTAVWSSAQPHSVQSMVERSFDLRWTEVKVIWARDTLDLDSVAYGKKSATIKDLTKMWKAFPTHSVRTTLLVDDSTDKARLQPWNHIHVKEYGHAERRSDLDHIEAKTATSRVTKVKTSKKTKTSDVSTLLNNLTLSSPSPKTTLSPPPSSSSSSFDSILLAVIGILDTLKHQDNVSGWLRGGGIVLCGGVEEGEMGDEGKEVWFDTVRVVEWWTNRGREVLGRMGIEIVVGVVA